MKSALASLILLAAITVAAQTTQPVSEQPQPGGTITGIVTNNDGDAIEGATLCTSYTTANGSGTSCGGAHSGEGGKFEIHVPLGEIGVFAQKQEGGYWPVVDTSPSQTKGVHKLTLTSNAPTATVTLKIGPRPGELKFNVKDKVTGEPIKEYMSRWIGVDDAMMWSLQIPATRMPIPAGIEIIVEVHAKGYRRWFYIDPSTSQPTLRLASGEERQLDVEMEPEEKK